jgi:hypothetical protein
VDTEDDVAIDWSDRVGSAWWNCGVEATAEAVTAFGFDSELMQR